MNNLIGALGRERTLEESSRKRGAGHAPFKENMFQALETEGAEA